MNNNLIKNQIKDNSLKAIVLFRYPNKKKINMISGTATQVADFNHVINGFVLQNFWGDKKFHIQKDKTTPDLELFKNKNSTNTTQAQFTKYIANIKTAIENKTVKKVVAARTLNTLKPKDFHVLDHFKKALQYKEAFVCLVFIENEICWLCASPELFLKTNEKEIETYSLAGTLKESLAFSEKEKEEQLIVTEFISETIASIPQLKKPTFHSKVISNGLLNHLLTVIKSKKKKKIHWSAIAEKLHPTPAVCGYPQKDAANFIKQNESFERSYYSGFLGEIKNGNAKTYVNLRCMEVTKNTLIYYAGCGITAESNARKEWIETNFKLDVMKKM